jgi:hypothetical protein
MLVLIDHTRAFPMYSKNPVLLYRGGVQVPPALGPYLHRWRIDALLKRHDQLLNEYRARAGDRERIAP